MIQGAMYAPKSSEKKGTLGDLGGGVRGVQPPPPPHPTDKLGKRKRERYIYVSSHIYTSREMTDSDREGEGVRM